MDSAGTAPLDVVGVGFGPANLALAVALEEQNADRPADSKVTSRFFELQPGFGWHRGMLIEGATMQVSFLKDLVTMRNPVSRYSFLSYLSAKNRLADFINSKTFYPMRVEFHDYFEWVADQFGHLVDYGSEVIEVRPVHGASGVDYFDVVYRKGGGSREPLVQRTRSVVIAAGSEPRMPKGLPESDRIWHTSRLMQHADRAAAGSPRAFVVLGSGQSAAEAVEYLYRRFTDAEVYAVHSRYGYSVADDSPFANQIFNPEAADRFYAASAEVRQSLLDYHGNTNYSVVDLDLIEDLYRAAYLETVTGRSRLRFLKVARLCGSVPGPDGVRVDIEHMETGDKTSIDADALVCATGYQSRNPIALLPGLVPSCKLDDQERLRLRRDHRVETDDKVRGHVYVQGYGEHAHGLSETLLSLTAVRAGEIARSIAEACHPVRAGQDVAPNFGRGADVRA